MLRCMFLRGNGKRSALFGSVHVQESGHDFALRTLHGQAVLDAPDITI